MDAGKTSSRADRAPVPQPASFSSDLAGCKGLNLLGEGDARRKIQQSYPSGRKRVVSELWEKGVGRKRGGSLLDMILHNPQPQEQTLGGVL